VSRSIRSFALLATLGALAPSTVDAQARVEHEPDWLLAAVENGLFVLGGVVWYWVDIEHNVADWDYESWEQRLTLDAFRYDNNTFHMNWLFHPLSGTAWYAFPRANHLDPWWSLLYSFSASWAWEFLAEFRERISINDTLVTPAAGMPMGEFMHRLGTMLWQDPSASPAARWILGFPVALHETFEGAEVGDVRPETVPWHRFELALGVGRARAETGAALAVSSLRASGRIAALDGYLASSSFGRFFHDAELSQLDLTISTTAEGAGLDLDSEAMLVGYHTQSIDDSATGMAFTGGTTMAFLYRTEDYDPWRERVSLLGLPGVALDAHLMAGPLQLAARGRLHGAFGGSHSAAWPDWEADNHDQTAKSILRKQGYYYGWGVWSRLELAMRLSALSTGAALSFSRLDSHEGLDRTQDAVTADVEASDTRLELDAWVRLSPASLPVHLEATFRQQLRTSWVETHVARPHLGTWGLSLGVTL
jgi:hypothetical protein